MRIQIPSKTIAVLSGATCLNQLVASTAETAKDSTNAIILRSKFARDVAAAYELDPMGQRQRSSSRQNRALERNKRAGRNNAKMKVDVGILTASGNGETKSKEVIYPLFLHGQKRKGKEEVQRILQDTAEAYVQGCPTGCPEEFCLCGWTHKEVKFCTKEMLDVCDRGLLSMCVPEKEIDFYETTYCVFSECIESGEKLYEECSCEYYGNYCTQFYDYQESFDKCVTADCCETTPITEMATCIPAMQPTIAPTGSPSVNPPPSASPTITPAPTESNKPTITPKPTPRPTESTSPTISPKPTPGPTTKPPTVSPTVSPTTPITAAPTSSAHPTTETAAPTVSAAPTVKATSKPTKKPKTNSPTYYPTVVEADQPEGGSQPSPEGGSQPSGGIVHAINILIPLCVGGTALWLLGL